MKIIQVEQGSSEWLSWRKSVITATDCPAILGSSPWSTAYKVWQRKLDLIPEQKSNEAMERGKRLEPEARAQFVQRFGVEMESMVVESTEFDFLGASLDGMSHLANSILEIKCGGEKLHAMAKKGEIPPYYMDQMQHQLLVTRASKCFYYSFDGVDGICIEVLPDPEFEAKFLAKAREFWKCVAFNEAPALQDSDYKDMSHDMPWINIANDYKKVSWQIKELEARKEEYRRLLLNLSGDQSCMGEGVRVMKTTVRGRVAYDEIPEIKALDLDKYRKGSTVTWKILVA
jgi:putative phage-type endonuclease